jgi:hypothetical protein
MIVQGVSVNVSLIWVRFHLAHFGARQRPTADKIPCQKSAARIALEWFPVSHWPNLALAAALLRLGIKAQHADCGRSARLRSVGVTKPGDDDTTIAGRHKMDLLANQINFRSLSLKDLLEARDLSLASDQQGQCDRDRSQPLPDPENRSVAAGQCRR